MVTRGTEDSADRGRNELKAGALLSYLLIGLQFVVAMAYMPVMLRLLGQTEYGLYSLVASIISYLSLLSFGLGGAYMRFHARLSQSEGNEGVAQLNGMFMLVFTGIGFLSVISNMAFALNVEALLGAQFSSRELSTARALMFILGANLAITFPLTVFTSFLVAHERFVFQKTVELARTLLQPILIVPVLLLGFRSIGIALATTSVSAVLAIYTVYFCLTALKMPFAFRGLRFSLLREVSVFSLYLFINMVVDQVNWNVDKFIVGRFHGAEAVAVYGVAAQFNMYYLAFSTAISNVFVPRVNRIAAGPEPQGAMSDLFVRVGRLQLVVLGLVVSGFVFFGQPFIILWAGAEYAQSYPIALLLLLPVTIPLIQNLGIEIQKARNLHQFRSWVYLAVAVGNVLLSIPLTQRYGGVGAAAATGIALVIGNGLIMNWHYQARVRLDIAGFWREIGRLAISMLPALAVGVALTVYVDVSRVVPLAAAVLLYAAVYAISLWHFGLNTGERQLFKGTFERVLRRR